MPHRSLPLAAVLTALWTFPVHANSQPAPRAPLSYAEQVSLAVMPKVTACLSMLGSSIIIYLVVIKWKEQRHTAESLITYDRLLFMMSVMDVINSFVYFLSSWPIPYGTPGVFGAVGTQQTCAAQGFIIQLGLAIPFYNGCLAINYLLVINKGWPERRVREVEPWLHMVSLLFPLATAIAAASMELFNNANFWCWIAPLPINCNSVGGTPCIRAASAWIYQWAFFYAELWAIMIFVAIAMLLVYLHVRKQEADTSRTLRSNASSNKSQSVARQGILYVAAFWLTWIFGTINRAYQTASSGQSLFPLLILHATFVPLQGFLNFLVYIRPRYINYRALHPEEKVLGAMTGALQGMFCCFPRRPPSSPASNPRANAPRAQTGAESPGKAFLSHINARKQQAAPEVQTDAIASRLLRLTTTDTQGTDNSFTESHRGSSVDLREVMAQRRPGDAATPAASPADSPAASPAASPRASTQLAQA